MPVVRLNALNTSLLEPIRQEAQAQGFNFIDRLVNEYSDGSLRFDKPGEALFAIFEGEDIVAIGGLTTDPFANDHRVGRVRRVYVLDRLRGKGLGREIVGAIVDEARRSYRVLTLRTPTPGASAFYERLGFRAEPPMPEATHHLRL